MTALSKTKSYLKPVVNFKSNSKSVKIYEWFQPKKYKGDNK